MQENTPENGVINMNNTNTYRAFGLTILSEFSLTQVPETILSESPDVTITRSDLSELELIIDDEFHVSENEVYFTVNELATFRITNGSLVEVDTHPSCQESRLSVYLMGSCIGAILHQRDILPIHGSCVTDGTHAIIITGNSGAGKSTLAAEFITHGWKLMTDDVAALSNIETIPTVNSSYPSQKLWQDSLEHYSRKEEDIHSLYFDNDREKFGVNVSDAFVDGSCSLSLIIRLCSADFPCHIQPIEGMALVDQLMQNTYRSFMIIPTRRQEHFRRCVALATKVEMALVIREKGIQCAEKLFEMITNYLGDIEHD